MRSNDDNVTGGGRWPDGFREALSVFSGETRTALTAQALGESVFRAATALVVPERIGFFTIQPGRTRLDLVAHEGFSLLEHRSVPLGIHQLRASLRRPVALEGCVEADSLAEPGDAAVFRRWGMALAFPLADPAGELLGFLVLGTQRSGAPYSAIEVTLLELLAAQGALALARLALQRRLRAREAESERLAALRAVASDFVAGVSHELRTPLTSIRMIAEMLRSRPGMARGRVRQYAGVIEGESERLTRLIENILDFSKIERGVKQYALRPTDLNEAVRRAMAILSYPLAMGSFEPSVHLANDPGTIAGDPDALCGALLNLVSNAMKYSATGRTIEVTTGHDDAVATVSVRDHGIGIAASEREQVFTPFFRSGRSEVASVAGAGLGLTLVRHCVEAHGGEVRVAGSPGDGTTMTIAIPLLRPHTP